MTYLYQAMRIYLDSNIFRYLKKPENKGLYDLFMADAVKNIYCFSEAHIYDLVRDTTDEKFADMAFMETIVANNCFSYNKRILFDHLTPREFYQCFDWTPMTPLFEGEDPVSLYTRTALSGIRVNFAQLTQGREFPPDFPEGLRTLFTQDTNLYEYMLAFVDFSTELTEEQKKFRQLIRYLHERSLLGNILEPLNILGFDGQTITDKDAFKTSYQGFFLKDKGNVYRYDLFQQQHTGLEFFGIVKGKPKKQKMMSLINDGRHAFFGAFCDIVVTEDADMLNKTEFLYDLYDIGTQVMTLDEFIAFQVKTEPQPDGFHAMLEVLRHFNELKTIYEESNGDRVWVCKKIPRTCWRIFDCVNFVKADTYAYHYFTKHVNNLSTGTLHKEITDVCRLALETFGPDLDGRNEFKPEELDNEQWAGRRWLIAETVIQLSLRGKLCLTIFLSLPAPPVTPP